MKISKELLSEILGVQRINMKRERHGDTGSRLYNIWGNMKARCNNIANPQYYSYGGRGIEVCFEWRLYSNFKKWALGKGYNNELSIDRIDNNASYYPDNCRWVDSKVQNNNKRNNIVVEETTVTLKCEQLGVEPKLVLARIREQDMTFNEAISLPQNFRHYKIKYNGEEYNLKSLCTVLNLNYDTVHKRIKKYGYSLQIATGCVNCEWILKENNGNK